MKSVLIWVLKIETILLEWSNWLTCSSSILAIINFLHFISWKMWIKFFEIFFKSPSKHLHLVRILIFAKYGSFYSCKKIKLNKKRIIESDFFASCLNVSQNWEFLYKRYWHYLITRSEMEEKRSFKMWLSVLILGIFLAYVESKKCFDVKVRN